MWKWELVENIVDITDIFYPTEHITWLVAQPREEELVKAELKKTVEEFIAGFKRLVVNLCKFDHERADKLRFFFACQYFGLNMVCGHPRLIRAKFKIAYLLLRRRRKISETEMEEYRERVYAFTEPLTGADFRATSGYRREFLQAWWIQENSPTGQNMALFQEEFGKKLTELRDEIAKRLETLI